jgi:putative transposase
MVYEVPKADPSERCGYGSEGNTARWLFLKRPELKRSLRGGHLWNPSYCAVTVSDRSREQVTHYIESQKEKG